MIHCIICVNGERFQTNLSGLFDEISTKTCQKIWKL